MEVAVCSSRAGSMVSMGPEEKNTSIKGVCSPNWGVETDYVHGDLMAAELWEASDHKLGLLTVLTDAKTLAPDLAASSSTQGVRPRRHPLR